MLRFAYGFVQFLLYGFERTNNLAVLLSGNSFLQLLVFGFETVDFVEEELDFARGYPDFKGRSVEVLDVGDESVGVLLGECSCRVLLARGDAHYRVSKYLRRN